MITHNYWRSAQSGYNQLAIIEKIFEVHEHVEVHLHLKMTLLLKIECWETQIYLKTECLQT